jgi:hypothetical protein
VDDEVWGLAGACHFARVMYPNCKENANIPKAVAAGGQRMALVTIACPGRGAAFFMPLR